MKFSKVTYIVTFANSTESIELKGIEALARFTSNDLYTVTGLGGRELTELELDTWERLTEAYHSFETLPKGLMQ